MKPVDSFVLLANSQLLCGHTMDDLIDDPMDPNCVICVKCIGDKVDNLTAKAKKASKICDQLMDLDGDNNG